MFVKPVNQVSKFDSPTVKIYAANKLSCVNKQSKDYIIEKKKKKKKKNNNNNKKKKKKKRI